MSTLSGENLSLYLYGVSSMSVRGGEGMKGGTNREIEWDKPSSMVAISLSSTPPTREVSWVRIPR